MPARAATAGHGAAATVRHDLCAIARAWLMLVFIVPLQSRRTSKDWALISALARRTLRSVTAQTDPGFRVCLVCTDVPNDCPSHPCLTIVQRAFPEPDGAARMADKWTKVKAGLVAVRDLSPCHVMVVDADDCVSNRLAAHVNGHADSAGWYFDDGWLHDEGSRFIYRKRHGFYDMCGTSSIVRARPEELPESESADLARSIILTSGHRQIRANMERRGTPLVPLPFPGAVYNLGTGENYTQFSLSGWKSTRVILKKMMAYRVLTSRLRTEFGLAELGTP